MMKTNILKITLISFLLILGFFVFQVKAGVVSITSDTDINLSGSGITVKARSGSSADSLTVDSNSFTVVVTGPDIFTVESPDKKKLDSSNANFSGQCLDNVSKVVINPSGTQSVTITPSNTACAAEGGAVILPQFFSQLAQIPTPTPAPTTPPVSAGLTPSELQQKTLEIKAKISELKTQLIALIIQRIEELKMEILKLQIEELKSKISQFQ